MIYIINITRINSTAMKTSLFIFVLIINYSFLIINCSAQVYASQQVIAPAGTSSTVSNATVSWTIGEPLTTTISNSNYLISQGFQQPLANDIATNLNKVNQDGINVSVFPNPTTDNINIRLTNNIQELKADLFDIDGKLLQRQIIKTAQSEVQLDLMGYAVAAYLLKVYSSDERTNISFKIEKLK